MKTCVVFAASIFDPARLGVMQEYFSIFRTHFSDADFYVGVNYGSIPNLENEIQKFGLNCYFKRVEDEHLYTKTDASAYQAALQLLKQSGNVYDIYWFGHTKGGVNVDVSGYSRNSVRKMYLDEMFSNRTIIEKMFEEYPHLGSWGIRGNSISAAGVQWKDYNVDSYVPICVNANIPPFNYTHVNWSYIETMFVLKKEAVEAYVNALPREFFTTPLNPWYMETVLPWVPSRCGYFPYIRTRQDYFGHCDLTDVTKRWIEENELTHLTPYLLI